MDSAFQNFAVLLQNFNKKIDLQSGIRELPPFGKSMEPSTVLSFTDDDALWEYLLEAYRVNKTEAKAKISAANSTETALESSSRN